jgi:hypothetical protein
MDDLLERILNIVQTTRDFALEFLSSHIRLVVGRTVNELFVVPGMIVSRLIRHHDAIELLTRNGFTSEASIIGLTQFELCLDVLYIGDNVGRARKWMAHRSSRSSPWKVKEKIDDIWASDPDTKETKSRYFEILSSVKHGNPTAGTLAFPLRQSGVELMVTSDHIGDAFSVNHAVVVGGVCSYHLIECLQGLSKAFARFVRIDAELDARRHILLEKCRSEIGRAMHDLGLIKSQFFH